jgi:group I intron endonuclease
MDTLDILSLKGKCGIYRIRHTDSGRCYIGSTKDLGRRYKNHFHSLGGKSRSCLHVAMKKYGVHSFSFEVMEYCNESDLYTREKYYIDIYNSASIEGFNTVSDPVQTPRNFKWQRVSRERLSRSLKGRIFSQSHISNISAAQKRRFSVPGAHDVISRLGSVQTAGSRKKISDALKGIPHSPIHNMQVSVALGRPIQQLNLDGVIVREFHSANYASKSTGIDMSHICKTASGKYKLAGGYGWQWINKP